MALPVKAPSSTNPLHFAVHSTTTLKFPFPFLRALAAAAAALAASGRWEGGREGGRGNKGGKSP